MARGGGAWWRRRLLGHRSGPPGRRSTPPPPSGILIEMRILHPSFSPLPPPLRTLFGWSLTLTFPFPPLLLFQARVAVVRIASIDGADTPLREAPPRLQLSPLPPPDHHPSSSPSIRPHADIIVFKAPASVAAATPEARSSSSFGLPGEQPTSPRAGQHLQQRCRRLPPLSPPPFWLLPPYSGSFFFFVSMQDSLDLIIGARLFYYDHLRAMSTPPLRGRDTAVARFPARRGCSGTIGMSCDSRRSRSFRASTSSGLISAWPPTESRAVTVQAASVLGPPGDRAREVTSRGRPAGVWPWVSYDGGGGATWRRLIRSSRSSGTIEPLRRCSATVFSPAGSTSRPTRSATLAVRVADWDLYVHQRTLLERHASANFENLWNGTSDLLDRARRPARGPRRDSGLPLLLFPLYHPLYHPHTSPPC